MVTFEPPQRVRESMERRARAHRPRLCVYDGCDQPAAVARGGRAARCIDCDRLEFTPPPVPDPTRTLTALRERLLEEVAA